MVYNADANTDTNTDKNTDINTDENTDTNTDTLLNKKICMCTVAEGYPSRAGRQMLFGGRSSSQATTADQTSTIPSKLVSEWKVTKH